MTALQGWIVMAYLQSITMVSCPPAASHHLGLSRNWKTKGGDILHPRLVRGRSLETDTTCQYCNTAIFGQPSLFCFAHQR
jgi:hypothetical protein